MINFVNFSGSGLTRAVVLWFNTPHRYYCINEKLFRQDLSRFVRRRVRGNSRDGADDNLTKATPGGGA